MLREPCLAGWLALAREATAGCKRAWFSFVRLLMVEGGLRLVVWEAVWVVRESENENFVDVLSEMCRIPVRICRMYGGGRCLL